MDRWRESGTQVDELHHLPGLENPADIVTKGRGTLQDLSPDGVWQNRPKVLQFPRDRWLTSQDFKNGKVTIPSEEIITSILSVNLLSSSLMLPINQLLERVEQISHYSDDLCKVQGTLPRYLRAILEGDCQAASLAPAVELLRFAESLLYLTAAPGVAELVESGRLIRVAPFWKNGRWVTRGRLGGGIQKVLGVSELPVLHKDSRLAYLVMVKAHRQCHKWAKETLHRSRSIAWIYMGLSLATKVVASCKFCCVKKIQSDQKIGDLPCQRFKINLPPWKRKALDLLGPMMVQVSVMTNKRAMKGWPLVITCFSTGAVHLLVMHNYSTQAFLLQREHFVSLTGCPLSVRIDRDPG